MREVLIQVYGQTKQSVNEMLLDDANKLITMGVWMDATEKLLPDEHIAGQSMTSILTGLFNWSEEEIRDVTLAELPEVQEMIKKAIEESRLKAVPPTSAAGSESGPAE